MDPLSVGRSAGREGVQVCVQVHECMCVYICMREHQGGRLRDPGEVAALWQADSTYPDSSDSPPTQPGCTQSSRDTYRNPHC